MIPFSSFPVLSISFRFHSKDQGDKRRQWLSIMILNDCSSSSMFIINDNKKHRKIGRKASFNLRRLNDERRLPRPEHLIDFNLISYLLAVRLSTLPLNPNSLSTFLIWLVITYLTACFLSHLLSLRQPLSSYLTDKNRFLISL